MGDAAVNPINMGLMFTAGLSDLMRPVYPLFLFLFLAIALSLRKHPFELKLYGVLLLVFYVLSSLSVLTGAVDEFFFRIEYMLAFFEVIKGLLAVWMLWTGACLFKDWMTGLRSESGPFIMRLSELQFLSNAEERFKWCFTAAVRWFIYVAAGIFFGMIIGSMQPHETVFNMIYHALIYPNRYYLLALIIYQMVLTLPFSAVLWLFSSVRGRKTLARWAETPSRLRIVCSAVFLGCPIAYGCVWLLNFFA